MSDRLTTFRTSFALIAFLAACSTGETTNNRKPWDIPLEGQSPEDLFTKLDLGQPGLEAVSAAVEEGDTERGFHELLHYFREKYPPKAVRATTAKTIAEADGVCRHEFFWEPYGSVDYGEEIHWEQDPVDDIQWVFRMYRFHWAKSLEQAYIATRDEKYAQAFAELTTDWIRKHPLDDWRRRHHKYTDWWGFAWRELQTGLRASHMSSALISMIHSEAVTPEFLAMVLASLYDHQAKTARFPMKALSNKAVAEQRGVLAVCVYFPEFSDTQRWATLAIERSVGNIMGQVTAGGVQREWCGGYHKVVMQDGLRLIQQADQLGVTIPDEFRERIRNMGEYVFAMATPDLGWPMFGDCGGADPIPEKRGDMALHHILNRLSGVWEDPKFSARARLDRSVLPGQTSYAFHDAGMFVMRSDWGPENIYFALHSAPPPLNRFHDQPDNGTFELFAFGRWLVTDSGYYIYGDEHEDRRWHRQTSVHQTLTLDRQDSKTDGRLLLWHTSPEFDAAVVENQSYEGLLHRRSVWFVEKEFFLILDEAIGDASGTLRLHWQPAAGPVKHNETEGWIETAFTDSNVRIETLFPHSPQIEEEEGWYAWTYGKRVPRKAFCVQHPEAAPAMFLTCVIPYRGTTAPQVELVEPPLSEPGVEAVEIRLRYSEKLWRVGRNLEKGTAWCNEEAAE